MWQGFRALFGLVPEEGDDIEAQLPNPDILEEDLFHDFPVDEAVELTTKKGKRLREEEPTSKDGRIVGELEAFERLVKKRRIESARGMEILKKYLEGTVEPTDEGNKNVGEVDASGMRHEASSGDKNVGDCSKGNGGSEEPEASGKRQDIRYPREGDFASCTSSDEGEGFSMLPKSVKGEPSGTPLEGENLRNQVPTVQEIEENRRPESPKRASPRRERSPSYNRAFHPRAFRPRARSYNKYLFLTIQAIYMILCAFGYMAAQYFSKNSMFKGGQQGVSIIIDSVYFVVVSFTTVGYGDITPNGEGVYGDKVKVVTGMLVLLGVMLMPMVFMLWNEAIDSLDDWILAKFTNYYLQNNGVHNIRKKIRIRITLAAIYALVCTGIGHLVLLAEHKSYGKMLYATVITQTTVGFGDLSFNSALGRSLASMWILLAAATTSRFIDLLVQSRLHKCSLTMLQKEMSASELEAAGITQRSSDLMFYLTRLKSIYMIDEEVVEIMRAQLFKFKSKNSSRKKDSP